MINHIKRVFRKLTPIEMASAELANAELELLEALSGREYLESVVTYNQTRIARLRKTLVVAAKEQPKNVQSLAVAS